MAICICILAKDESAGIGAMLAQLARQSIFSAVNEPIIVHVVANGCSDNTAAVAAGCTDRFQAVGADLRVHDIHPGGKSRAWNRMVHEFAGADTSRFIFLDADVEFVDNRVIADLLSKLDSDEGLLVSAGYPLKNISAKADKSLSDRFSLAISNQTRPPNAICGQLYAVRSEALREVWLPNDTPGEDGFLNAMINTRGFTQEYSRPVVVGLERPTHYFENFSPRAFVHHERRLIIGTIINRWIFEHLWSLKLSQPAGLLIKQWNESGSDWVEQIIQQRTAGKFWLVPNAITFGRFSVKRRASPLDRLAYYPLALLATLASLPSAVSANARLRKAGAAKTW